MLLANVTDYPYNYRHVQSRSVSYEFTQVSVIGGGKLVLNQHLPAGANLFCENIGLERPHRCFTLHQFEFDSKLFSK